MKENELAIQVANGLRRISVVLWSLCGTFLALSTLGTDLIHYDYGQKSIAAAFGMLLGGGIMCFAIMYGLHRLTCWIISGFSRP